MTEHAPHPNSIAANLHKLTEEQRELYDKNRDAQIEDAMAMEAWAKKITGKSKFVEGGLSQDPLANEGSHSPRKHRAREAE